MEQFNEVVTWVNVNLSPQIVQLGIGLFITALTIAFIRVLDAIRGTEKGRLFEVNLKLVREMALVFVANAGGLDQERLEMLTTQGDEAGLTEFDPRMIYVLVELERYIQSRGMSEFDVLELVNIAEDAYLKHSN